MKIVKNSIYGKNFKLSDALLKFILFFSFFIVSSIFLFFIFHIFKNGLLCLNFKLINNIDNGVQKGILPSIINTFYVVILTLIIATPIGLGTAIYITQYKKQGKLSKFISFSTNILASVPSILIGLFGYSIFCFGFGLGSSILAGCLTVSCCVLPNIIETVKESLLAVPSSYKKAALALGATKFKVIFGLIIPNALPGILTALILSTGKIIGESAALLLTIGAANRLPQNILGHIFNSGQTLTLNLYYTAANANSKNTIGICYAISIILLLISLTLNLLTKLVGLVSKK